MQMGSPGSIADGPVIEVQSADKVYGATQALSPVDFRLDRGEFVSLIGPSGCGKSTLLGLMANLIEPTDGGILRWRKGFDTVGQPGRRISMVFQDATLMPWSRAIQNVRIALELGGQKVPDADERAMQALQQVGMERSAQSYPRRMSGGQRMRVSIARALVTQPDLLLMDEPFGALDELTRNRLDEDLSRMCGERGIGTVFVTHSIYEAVYLSTRVVVMAANPGRIFGELVIDGPLPRDEAFRDTPEFARLCRELSHMLRQASQPLAGEDTP